MFETFSYLPPLSDDQIARQVDYIVNNNWTPCLEFSEPENAYVQSNTTGRMGAVTSVSAARARALPAAAAAAPQLQRQQQQQQPDLAHRTRARPAAHTRPLLPLPLPSRAPTAELLRQQVLDHVEAAHVRLHRPRAGASDLLAKCGVVRGRQRPAARH
jgi:ribulose-bisphosphate carboxylase small chain